jgi:AcrR family transcriptional regulator
MASTDVAGAEAAPDDATGDPGADSPRERRRAQRLETRRREILAVAEELFIAHGYDGTSLEKIANGSGYSVGGIYNFFPSKDAVYAAVLDKHNDAMTQQLIACINTQDSGMFMLLAMASTAIANLREFPHRTRLTVHSMTAPRDSPASRQNFRTVLETYAAAVAAGQRDGTVRAGDPRQLAQYVGGLVLAHAQVDPVITGRPDGVPLEDFLDILSRALSPT